MSVPIRIFAGVFSAALIAAACGGAANAPSPATAAVTTAAATATTAVVATSTVAPSAAPTGSPAPPYAGVGAASVKLSETKTVAKTVPVHIGFVGDEPSLAAGTYLETMNLVTLQPGGRTISHKHGGIEIVIVTEGAVEINMGALGKKMLKAGETAKVPANTPLQASNPGTTVATFLALFMTADGQPFQTNLTAVP